MRARQVVVSCEHASNRVPRALGTLGLARRVLESHVAWDPGAADVARAVARRLGCPLHLGRWSRLVVDLNRSVRHRKLVPEVAWGVRVPGNADLSEKERTRRLVRWAPWRHAVLEDVWRAVRRDGSCLHLSFHSFTPVLHGRTRNTDLGVLYDPSRRNEKRFADVLVAKLAPMGLVVHRNRPYRGTADGLTTHLRRRVFDESEYLGLELEVSQRLLRDERAWKRLVPRLGDAVASAVDAFAPTRRPRT